MIRKGTETKTRTADEAFSPDPSSEDKSDSDDDDYIEDYNDKTMVSSSPPPASSPSTRPSRHAAKKASATIACYKEDLPGSVMEGSDLLSEALAPMKKEDKDDHKAWVELESDPVRL